MPVATYRLQLSRDLPFGAAEALVPYLHRLGVTDFYCSPILAAGVGSTHGYDISNHAEINPELGSRDDLRELSARLRERGMGLIVDFVPNHMGNDARANAWWWDVLENGPGSPYARYFDIDWLPVKAELRDKVLLPILGDQYGVVLERGELQLEFGNGGLTLRYFERVLPINPRQAPLVLGHGIDNLVEEHGAPEADVADLRRILAALLALPASAETGEETVALRQRKKEEAREALAALVARSEAIRAHVRRTLAAFNGTPGDAPSFDRLHGLLEVQSYRLAYWRTAFDEINYRRFFDINDLAGLRMEDPPVFAASHALLLDLVRDGTLSGIRIDHPDGLYDPAGYLGQLRAAVDECTGDGRSVYIVVEKILTRGERLRESWPVEGTTGYDALNAINGVFVSPDGLPDLRRSYRQFTGFRARTADTLYAAKRFMMRSAMASELNMLTRALNRLSEGERRYRDFTLNGLRRALTEVIACFPVYRTYVTAAGASGEDVAVVDAAIAEARRRNPVQEPSIFAFIRQALLPTANGTGTGSAGTRELRLIFAQKFQQYTAPVVAKGVEDTAFYNDVLLVSANEVGGDVRQRVRSVAALHAANEYRLSHWPQEMTAGSTHDTKWGEDARARINVLSELPQDWRLQIKRWSAIADEARVEAGERAPDRNDEWLFYQALVGAWPAEPLHAPVPARASDEFVERMRRYMRKALKEAKRHTGWLHENLPYEQAVDHFVETLLRGEPAAAFLRAFVPFQRRVAWFGMLNSLSQLVLRLAAPGVPDIYQGSELWNLSMVDPDNRQPVDFACRRRMLDALEPALDAVWAMHTTPLREQVIDDRTRATAQTLAEIIEHWPDGRVKLYTLAAALRLRREHASLFIDGDYEAIGDDTDDPHLVGFIRRHEERELVVLVPRLVATLLRGDVVLPLGMERWRTASVKLPRRLARAQLINTFTGEVVQPVVYRDVPWLLAGSAFQSWPVSMFRVAY